MRTAVPANKLKSKLVERGIKQNDIAKRLNVSAPAVCRVINGVDRSRRIEKAVAKAIGERPQDVFPHQRQQAA